MALLDPSKIEWIYAPDWYDGPISGVIEYYGIKLWAQWTDSDAPNALGGQSRIYSLYMLDEEDWAREYEQHKCFVENVGNHWEFAGEYYGVPHTMAPKELNKNYYNKYPPESMKHFIDFNKYFPIAYFKE